MDIAYIVSSAYSGSTLLSLMLNSHPEIGTISEFDVIHEFAVDDSYPCSCGEKLIECPFFKDLRANIRGQGIKYSTREMNMMISNHRNRLIDRILYEGIPLIQSSTVEDIRDKVLYKVPYFRRKMNNYHQRNEALFRGVLKLQNASIFLDANKNPYRMKRLSKRHNVKAIYLYKNGIAGVYSFIKAGNTKGISVSIEQACDRWFKGQLMIGRCLNYVGKKNIIKVSYSELCNNTQEEVNKIYELLGIPPHPIDDFRDKPHHIIGNTMRMIQSSEVKEATAWKSKLTNEEKQIYLKYLGKYSDKLEKINSGIVKHLWHGQ